MMKKLFFTLLLMTTGLFFMAQSVAGDYRSVTGTELEWQDNATWEKFDGTIWVTPAPEYPAEGGTDITYTVTIPLGADVVFGFDDPFTLNIGSTGQPGKIIIENGAVLDVFVTSPAVEFIIADNGTVTVDGSLNCTGDIINNGEMTVNGAYTNAIP